MLYLRLAVVVGLGRLAAHVLVPELAELADSEVLAGAKEGVAGVLPQDVRRQLVGLRHGGGQWSQVTRRHGDKYCAQYVQVNTSSEFLRNFNSIIQIY